MISNCIFCLFLFYFYFIFILFLFCFYFLCLFFVFVLILCCFYFLLLTSVDLREGEETLQFATHFQGKPSFISLFLSLFFLPRGRIEGYERNQRNEGNERRQAKREKTRGKES